jgi:serine phosphatase RsbU (regulator of sigma subunit)
MDGTVTIASAGHPAPYLEGREVETPPGLPLGLAAGQEYSEIRLPAGTGVVTLVTDGVVEAENAAGELFGFERTRAISGKSAGEIAAAAKAWGQNDDITVVTVRRQR